MSNGTLVQGDALAPLGDEADLAFAKRFQRALDPRRRQQAERRGERVGCGCGRGEHGDALVPVCRPTALRIEEVVKPPVVAQRSVPCKRPRTVLPSMREPFAKLKRKPRSRSRRSRNTFPLNTFLRLGIEKI